MPLASLVYGAGPRHIANDETLASLAGVENLRQVAVTVSGNLDDVPCR